MPNPMMMTNKPVALITGASRGIGKAIAFEFAQNGFDLVICSKNNQTLFDTQHQLKSAFPNIEVKAFSADLSSEQGCSDLVNFYCKEYQHLTVLVNNAGTFLPGTLMDENQSQMRFQMDLNFFSAYFITKGVWHLLKSSPRAHIFNMCSIASITAYAAGGGYSVSKFALLGFSKSLRLEGIPHNIAVSAVLPGATLTDSWAGVDLPESRFMRSQDVASVLLNAFNMNERTVMEEIVIRPVLGDI
jgi:short-subunit dehydrogenase